MAYRTGEILLPNKNSLAFNSSNRVIDLNNATLQKPMEVTKFVDLKRRFQLVTRYHFELMPVLIVDRETQITYCKIISLNH